MSGPILIVGKVVDYVILGEAMLSCCIANVILLCRFEKINSIDFTIKADTNTVSISVAT